MRIVVDKALKLEVLQVSDTPELFQLTCLYASRNDGIPAASIMMCLRCTATN